MGYCSFCGKRLSDQEEEKNFDSWFNISWCDEHKNKPPIKKRYECRTGKEINYE